MTDFFLLLNNNGSHDPKGQIRDHCKSKKVNAPKHAISGNILTKMESLGNVLQNAT